ncbi:MAG: aspartate 1-decarboxylase [Nitrospirota bacterium]|jgi:aspartate 1-decarboxylase
MFRPFLRAKIHRATITDANLDYEGSITIDAALLKAADIKPYEQVAISNLNNGERFDTYAIPGKKGEMCLNGPTARKGQPGDKIIVFSYSWLDEAEMEGFEPRIIKVDGKNRIIRGK